MLLLLLWTLATVGLGWMKEEPQPTNCTSQLQHGPRTLAVSSSFVPQVQATEV
jgi:hypothetical protein